MPVYSAQKRGFFLCFLDMHIPRESRVFLVNNLLGRWHKTFNTMSYVLNPVADETVTWRDLKDTLESAEGDDIPSLVALAINPHGMRIYGVVVHVGPWGDGSIGPDDAVWGIWFTNKAGKMFHETPEEAVASFEVIKNDSDLFAPQKRCYPDGHPFLSTVEGRKAAEKGRLAFLVGKMFKFQVVRAL